ncbi:hypothetical protein JQ473_16540 [Brucella melitensis]|nr:hypothetical protein [Brucella melitensis]
MMDAQTFARIAAGLPAFLKASLAPHLIERPVSDLRRHSGRPGRLLGRPGI